jgi:uncharacterized protein YjbI with pentapeptide repeats
MSNKKIARQKEEEISAKAYDLWEARQKQNSESQDDWNEAIKILEEEKRLSKFFKPFKKVWSWLGLGDKKGLDVLLLLLAPPILTLAGLAFQDYIKQKELQAADDKVKQETLIKYLDQMSDLLQKGLLKKPQKSETSTIARAKTVIALQSLDSRRQHLIIQFLEVFGLDTLYDGKGILFESRMTKAMLAKADLSGSNLTGVIFTNANLEEADFTGAILSKANLYEANLMKSTFKGATLSMVDFTKANLVKSNFSGSVDLIRTNFQEVNLTEADFSEVTLFTNSNFQKADLTRAMFTNSNFEESNFRKAKLHETILFRLDFSKTKMLTNDQFEGEKPPLICKVDLPKNITVNANRDCEILPQVLFKRYPEKFKTIEEAQDYMNQ